MVLLHTPTAFGSLGSAKYTGLRCGATSSAMYRELSLDELVDDPTLALLGSTSPAPAAALLARRISLAPCVPSRARGEPAYTAHIEAVAVGRGVEHYTAPPTAGGALLLGVELELGNADVREQDGCLDACEVEGRRLGAAKPEMTVVVGEVRAEDVGREAGLLGPATGRYLRIDVCLLWVGWTTRRGMRRVDQHHHHRHRCWRWRRETSPVAVSLLHSTRVRC